MSEDHTAMKLVPASQVCQPSAINQPCACQYSLILSMASKLTGDVAEQFLILRRSVFRDEMVLSFYGESAKL